MRMHAAVALALLVVTLPVAAAEVHVVQGVSYGMFIGGCLQTLWSSDVIFFNRSGSDKAVTLLSMSNGGTSLPQPHVLSIPARRSVSLIRAWGRQPAIPLWVLKMDVPPEVSVDSVLYVGDAMPCAVSSPPRAYHYGKTKLPVFRKLTPPQTAQLHMGTDLGPAVNSRVNVGIYNDAEETAVATVDLYRTCDDTRIESRIVTIPAKTVVQITMATSVPALCDPEPPETLARLNAYVIVTVDQTSATFTSTISNVTAPTPAIRISGETGPAN